MNEEIWKALLDEIQKQSTLHIKIVGALVEVTKCLPSESREPVWEKLNELLVLNSEENNAMQRLLSLVAKEFENAGRDS
jgi:hypothetical protein